MNKLNIKILSLNTNLLIKQAIPYFWLVVISFWFALPPLNETDSFIWYYMIKNMPNFVPYLDLFDHKGPLLYAIYRIGYLLTGNLEGIYYLRHLSTIISLVFAYKMLTMWYKSAFLNILAILICFIYPSFYIRVLADSGGLAENFVLGFIFSSLYLFAKYCKFAQLSRFEAMVVGIGFGAALLLKVNLVGLWLAIFMVVAIKEYRDKALKIFLTYLLYAIIGLFIVVLPFIIYYGSKHALKAMWESYILFNIFDYSPSTPWNTRLDGLKTYLYITMGLILLFFLLKIEWLKKYKNMSKTENYFHLFEILFFSISMVLLNISGRPYFHYIIPILPTFLLSMSTLLNRINGKLISCKYNYLSFNNYISFIIFLLLLPLVILFFMTIFLETKIIETSIPSFIWFTFIIFIIFKIFMNYVNWEQLQKFIVGGICFIAILSVPLLHSFQENSIKFYNPYVKLKEFRKNTLKKLITNSKFKRDEFYPRKMELNKHSGYISLKDIAKDVKLNSTLDDKILVFMDPGFAIIYDLSGNKPSHQMFFIPSQLNSRPPLIEFLETNPKIIIAPTESYSYKKGEYEQLVKRYNLLKVYNLTYVDGEIGLYKKLE